MHFILNIDPAKKPVGTALVRLETLLNIGYVDSADLMYAEYRYDQESKGHFVCIVYRMPEVDRDASE